MVVVAAGERVSKWSRFSFHEARFGRDGDWILFLGPGARMRAISIAEPRDEGGLRARFVVVASDAPDVGVLATLSSRAVVIAKRGVCTAQELVEASRESGAFLDVDVAVDLVLRGNARADATVHHTFRPQDIEIDAHGDVVVLRALHNEEGRPNSAALAAFLATLLTGKNDVEGAIERLTEHYMRATVARLLTVGTRWTPRDFCARLAELAVPKPEPARLGDVVRALFPERVSVEEALDEELALLDRNALLALVDRPRKRGRGT